MDSEEDEEEKQEKKKREASPNKESLLEAESADDKIGENHVANGERVVPYRNINQNMLCIDRV